VKSSQREYIVPDYSKTLAELYLDAFLAILDGDKATGNGFPTVVHPIGKDLITCTEMLQNILEDPLWNKDKNSFDSLESISRDPQLTPMNPTLYGIGIETVSMIFQIGNTMTPRSQFLVSLVGTDKGDKLNTLNTRDFCRTRWIGTRYIKDVSSEQFGPLLDSQGQVLKAAYSTRQGNGARF